jgi:H+/Cl- antiporter ClcA
LVCTIILIGYLWFIYLPQFEGTAEYQPIRIIVLFVILLLLLAAGAQIILMRRPPKTEEIN